MSGEGQRQLKIQGNFALCFKSVQSTLAGGIYFMLIGQVQCAQVVSLFA